MSVIIVLFSIFPVIFIAKKSRGETYNSAIKFFCIAYVFYAGVCILLFELPIYYLWLYLIFSFSFFSALNFSYKLSHRFGEKSNYYFENFIGAIFTKRNKNIFILNYIGLSVAPLLFPEFRFFDLLNPPTPDLQTAFNIQFQNIDKSPFISAVELLKQLLLPFFYISLYDRSRTLLFPFLALTLVFYTEYVASGYKSRGQLIVNYFPLLFYYWCSFPRRRLLIILTGAALLPFALLLFNFYEIYRLDSTTKLKQFEFFSAAEYILRSETSFVDAVGITLIETKARVDLPSYFKWIVTLPLPKFIFGAIEGARINTEISEIILGTSRGMEKFYIVLPGLIAESVFIYGELFFWLHAVTLGALFGFLLRFFGKNENLIYLVGYIVALAMYNLNRGGIASFLPQIINQLFLMYLIFILYRLKLFRLFSRNGKHSSNR